MGNGFFQSCFQPEGQGYPFLAEPNGGLCCTTTNNKENNVGDRAKYIVLMRADLEIPIIFPAFVEHAALVGMMGLKREDVISAGFVLFHPSDRVGGVEVHAYGESISLDAKAREADTELIYKRIIE